MKKADPNCDWCFGNGVALADCGDKREIQKCDNCKVYRNDEIANKAVFRNTELQQKIGVTGKLLEHFEFLHSDLKQKQLHSPW